ncbi:hypothetical protein RHMOL_Rhmol02G0271800 [Rhododendron molle]|uniref:Uncharacterized protein n=6 Tax=Rhododendron molle TaxID=49168 RepID=A0ACC0PUC2_RHOML|nr:hypothetical protein RHMOL_Rhmol02G0271800 [Rhododendron molle]KAI8569344.1 hypothetical protein RHMOL_Rhmol02G0271800 [Rhododendron molle]KAI8569345.1 hypothetical protein RHMOL_Rhmol02G0271800 [Rhododendron molle]KAI8569346.1 hypothetical protein RHMOL_Rhmol02G0271800 [Rhododendron molle]KAI8569347.1 hypothetical protein RHMOL_Rhmol02G0271800 [Rhododendron molle]
MACSSSSPQKFVADGVFFAELNDVLTRELAEVRVTPMRIEIAIRATRYLNILAFLKFPSVIERRCQRATDEPGKQMRSDVRIKNTSSSHVASSDIGDEMPMTRLSPVEIEKDDSTAAGGSGHDNKGHAIGSSSSSSGDSSSSSDSESGSSSGSDSDEDDAESRG